MSKINLTATVSTTPVEKRCKFLTKVLILNGALHVAHATLGGKFNATDALAEFKKNPAKFTATPKFVGALLALAKAA